MKAKDKIHRAVADGIYYKIKEHAKVSCGNIKFKVLQERYEVEIQNHINEYLWRISENLLLEFCGK